MESNIDRTMLEALREGLRGAAYVPGDGGYDDGELVKPSADFLGVAAVG